MSIERINRIMAICFALFIIIVTIWLLFLVYGVYFIPWLYQTLITPFFWGVVIFLLSVYALCRWDQRHQR